ncbi:MAG TPA: hypothetical protein VGM74_09170 [Burkholderiaceae bacterium]
MMDDDFKPIDHGPRSNESAFGDLDPLPVSHETFEPRRRVGELIVERLPFSIGVVDDEATLKRVQALRQTAYGHHLPELAPTFGRPDPMDRSPDATLFYAEDKITGQMVGSARLQVNRSGPLLIEGSLELPPQLRGRLLSEVARLTVLPGYTPPVRLALVKVIHLFCVANQIGGIVVGARRSLLRIYENIGFSDLFGDNRMVPLAHTSGMPHRVLFRDPVTSEAEGRARNHPDYAFVFRTYHPDIKVFEPVLMQTHRGIVRALPDDQRYNSRAA